jgi:hypothetical protein
VLVDYAGATTRVPVEKGLTLDPTKWSWQPKIDGAYARVVTDRAGRIATVMPRGSNRLSKYSETGHSSYANFFAKDLDGILGMATGLPDSVLFGELEACTEASVAARERRGWAKLYLFDCGRWCGRSVAAEPFSARYGLLHRWQANVETYGEVPREDWWTVDAEGDAHGPAGEYVRPVPRDLRRLPIVPLARGPGAGAELWRQHVLKKRGEGIVAVRLDAALGKRAVKLKIKATDTYDCPVISYQGTGCAVIKFRGVTATVSARGRWAHTFEVGDILEVAVDGFYKSGMPRHPRIVRVRRDLA